MKPLIAVALALLSSAGSAHKVVTTFPDGASPLSSDALRLAIENREFTARPAASPAWHLRYQKNGEFAVKAGDFTDEGQWKTNEGSVCTEGKRLKYLCNGVRIKDGKLYFQRKDGEVMQLIPM